MPEYLAIPDGIYRRLNTGQFEKVPLTIQGELYMLLDRDSVGDLRISDGEGLLFKDLYEDWVESLRLGKASLAPTDYDGVYIVKPPKVSVKAKKQKLGKSGTATLKRAKSLEDKYVNFCGTRNLKALAINAERHINKILSKIEKLQEEMTKAVRHLSDRQRALESIKSGKTLDANLRLEFQKLSKHPDIEKIVINGTSIVVKTKPIYINYKDQDYPIGQFKITIYSNGKNGGVIMENLTNLVKNKEGYYMHHPHIRSKNKNDPPFVCLGNIQETIATLIGERQYPALISICIEYLKSYNDEDSLAEPPTSWKEKRK